MREAQLRDVLLIKAIEETDGTEPLISAEDRKAATREAARNSGDVSTADAASGGRLSGRAQRMLVSRAEFLLPPLVRRYPDIADLSRVAGGSALIGLLLIVASVLVGGGLSMLDGTRRIDILSLPLLGLILWNLLVYTAVIAGSLRSLMKKRPRRPLLPIFVSGSVLRQVRRFVSASARHNTLLAASLERFTPEWWEAAKPLLLARAARLFHLCAAAAGVGLICALYLRSLTADYSAGWESTFLDANDVHTFVSIIYGPASAVTGIPIPDASHLDRIRWQSGGGGERAAYWIHLLAASVALYIVVPRLVFAAIKTVSIWRHAFSAALPASLAAYFGRTFGDGRALAWQAVTVVPYGYEPSDAALAKLRSLLSAALGDAATVSCLSPVRYGDEDALTIGNGETPVVLLNLAATPEEETHGVALDRVQRRATASSKALAIVDEGPYASRMSAAGGAPERMNERRRLWQDFVERHGPSACFVNLAAGEQAESERLRAALLQL